jgi:catechol 2,3-dioxygenase-like lactoylglutathione lyase family enzyme
MLQKLHHVAYRCTNAAQTVDFYTRLLGLELVHALTNDYVPSVKRYDPHLHIFFAMEDGSYPGLCVRADGHGTSGGTAVELVAKHKSSRGRSPCPSRLNLPRRCPACHR